MGNCVMGKFKYFCILIIIQMKLNEIQKKELKEKVLTIRTYLSYSDWIKKNQISPSLLFNKALEELMEQEEYDRKQ